MIEELIYISAVSFLLILFAMPFIVCKRLRLTIADRIT